MIRIMQLHGVLDYVNKNQEKRLMLLKTHHCSHYSKFYLVVSYHKS